MIVGPHSTKLPKSWDTGSDQPSVPAVLLSWHGMWLTQEQLFRVSSSFHIILFKLYSFPNLGFATLLGFITIIIYWVLLDHVSVRHLILHYSSIEIANSFIGITFISLFVSGFGFRGFSSHQITERIPSCQV